MQKQFWHNSITDKSFAVLQGFKNNFRFVLIGGWAIYFYTKALKSKDIDMVVDLAELGKLKQRFKVIKNERLKKYEIKGDGFDIDIYIPHWSELGFPLDLLMKELKAVEGFLLPDPEILFTLKLFVYTKRKHSLKGKKDAIDIISLLYHKCVDILEWRKLLKELNLIDLQKELSQLLQTTYEIKELGLNKKKFADFKRVILNLEMGAKF